MNTVTIERWSEARGAWLVFGTFTDLEELEKFLRRFKHRHTYRKQGARA